MNRETETHSPEGMREADGDAGRIERLIASIDACRACPARKEGRVCADCALDQAV